MRNTVLATAVAATQALAAPQAFAQAKGSATKAEVQAIEAQMKALAERLNKLESTNTQLQSENAELKAVVDRREAEIDYLKSQTRELREEGAVASNEIGKVKGADWATKLKGRGDFRYRHEMIDPERVVNGQAEDAADRTRHRIRARLGFDYKVTDTLKGTLLFATGGDDPRSSNQTLGGTGTRKSIGVDMAYVDWKFMDGANLVLGKQPHPYFRPGQSMFFDGDFNPEGGAVKFDRGMFFGTGYGWWLTEQYNANPKGENNDSNLFGAQVGMKFPLLGGETVLAAHYFDCGACQDNSPLYANNGNGNTTFTLPGSTTNLLRYDYEILQLSAQMGTTLLGQPFTFWADYGQNMASGVEYDTAYGVGVVLGKASNAKTWEVGLSYQDIGKDALFAQFIDSDFGDGVAGADGWVLKAGYAPVRNVTLNATYLKNQRTICGTGTAPNNRTCGAGIPEYELDYDRWQLDVNYKF